MNTKQNILVTSTFLILIILASMPAATAFDFSDYPDHDCALLEYKFADADGHFSFSGLPDGEYKLYSVWQNSKVATVTVTAGSQNIVLDEVTIDKTNMTEAGYAGYLSIMLSQWEKAPYSGSNEITGTTSMKGAIYLLKVNHAPYAPELSSNSNTSLIAGTPLKVKVIGPLPTDPDDDIVTYTYNWFVDTGSGYVADEDAGRGDHTTGTVPSAHTLPGDIWKIQVTATDTYGSDTVAEIVFPVLEEPPEEFVTITRHVNISCIVLDDEGTYMLREAAAQLNLTDQGVNISVYGFSRAETSNVSYTKPEDVDLGDSDVIVLFSMTAMSFMADSAKEDVIDIVNGTKREDAIIIDIGGFGLGTVDLEEHPYLEEYWANFYSTNAERLLAYILTNLCDAEGYVEPPIAVPTNGIYHPDMGRPSFETLEEYMEWYSADDGTHHVYDANNTTIGITFLINTNGMIGNRAIDDLIWRLESRGINVIPAHMHWVLYTSTPEFFKYDNEWLVDGFIDMGMGAMLSAAIYDTGYLQEANVPVINAIQYEETIEEWENSSTGRDYRFHYQIPIMEIGGEIESIVVSGKKYDETHDVYVDEPIPKQMEWMINRTLNWIELKRIENEDRKVALIYYHHSPGRDGAMAAANLDSAPSIVALLEGMEERGYSLGNSTPNQTELLQLVLDQGRNIGSWAPGELEKIVSTNETELMPVEEYMEMFSQLPEDARKEVIEIWGEAPGDLMVYENESGKYFVFPKITLGNVILTPQPTRGGTNNSSILYHDQTTPPDHHYIAFYMWLQKQYGADVVIHFGQHGTQEWLKGKGVGLSVTEDWPAIVIGDMPVVYIYNVGGISEGSVAKRRGNAVIVDHATPAIVDAGLYGDLLALHDKIHLYSEADQDNDSIKYDYRNSTIELYDSLGLESDPDVNVSVEELTAMTEEEFEAFVINGKVHDYLHELASANMPYGLHILGEPLEGEELIAMVQTMLGSSFKENIAAVFSGDDELLEAANEDNLLHRMLADLLLNGTEPEKVLEMHLNETPDYYNEVVGVTTTDSKGDFSFTNLEGGSGVTYSVYALTELSGEEFMSGNDLLTINDSGNTVCDLEMNYTTMQQYNDIKANLPGNASLSGQVFYISGMNSGARSTKEGMTVLLRQEESIIAVDKCDANGNFSFINLPAGTYTLNAYYYWDVPEMGSKFYFVDQETTEHTLGENDQINNYDLKVYSSGTEAELNELQSLTDDASISGQSYYTLYGNRVNSPALVILAKQSFRLSDGGQKVFNDLETAGIYAENLYACGDEIESVLNALEGQYIVPGLGDDPIRSPSVLPTGKNFYSFNPYLIPSEETWKLGVELADDFLEEWKANNNGSYPKKVGFVLWSAETMRHKGIMESEILYLMGTRPVWENGILSDVEVIPCEELTHPRIDVVVTITGVYRDTWALQVEMMDRAVEKVSELNESDCGWANYVKEDSDALYELLMATGNYTEEEASSLSQSRIFGPPEGMFSVGSMNSVISRSDTWNGDESMLADLYLSTMSNVYSEDAWGEMNTDLFSQVLSGTEAIVFSRSGNDGRGSSGVVFDHVNEFLGGMSLAIKSIDGERPDMYIADLRDMDNMETTTLESYLIKEMRSTYYNTKWIEGMMAHGYAGAAEMESVLSDLWGLEVTTGAVTDEMWQQMYDIYVTDSYDLGMEEWFNSENPWARQTMIAQMLDATRTDYWDASDEVIQNLVNEYQQSLEEYGPCCCALCCGNALLDDYVQGMVTVPGMVSEASQTSSSSGGTGGGSVQVIEASKTGDNSGNQTATSDGGYGLDASQPDALHSTNDNYVEGVVMQHESVSSDASSSGMSFSGASLIGTLLVVLTFGVIYAGFRRNK